MEISFNTRAVWIKRDTWKKYLSTYYLPYVKQQCDKLGYDINKYEYYCSPLDCNISQTSFRDSSIREIHQTLLSLISEYSSSENQFREIKLSEKALSNIFAANATKNVENNKNAIVDTNANDYEKLMQVSDFQHIANAVAEGKLDMLARSIATLDISRGSTDDCSISKDDFIWCFKRLVENLEDIIHVAIRVTKVSFY